MAVTLPNYVLQASSHSAELFRRAMATRLAGTGVMSSTDLKVTQDTGSNMKTQVAAGQAWIPGTLGATAGMPADINKQSAYGGTDFTTQAPYYGYNDAAVTLTHSTSNPTNPRIDLVVATVRDAQYAGSNNDWLIQIVTGTPAASPAAPTPPANSLVLAEVAVAANATAIVTANITDKRPYATRSTRFPLYGAGSPLHGSVPVDGLGNPVNINCQAGGFSGTTNGSGAINVTYPKAFANQTLMVWADIIYANGASDGDHRLLVSDFGPATFSATVVKVSAPTTAWTSLGIAGQYFAIGF